MATPVSSDMQCLFAREIDASLQLAKQAHTAAQVRKNCGFVNKV